MVKVTWNYKGLTSEFYLERDDFVIGRLAGEFKPQVQLNLDMRVSPKHARVWKENGSWWAEDLGSAAGTFLNDERLTDAMTVGEGSVLKLGNSQLCWEETVAVEQTQRPASSAPRPPGQSSRPSVPATSGSSAGGGDPAAAGGVPANVLQRSDGSQVLILSAMGARQDAPMFFDTSREDSQLRIAQLLELPLLMAGETELGAICRKVLNRVVDLIPGAERGAFLVLDPETNKLALRAGIPAGNPPISRTLIKKAAQDGCGFIWNDDTGAMDPSASMKQHAITSGIYAPLMWRGEVMGVLCVDNPHRTAAFQDEDLRFLMAVAHYAASAIANHHMQKRVTDYSVVLESLLTNFSPKLRGKLVEKARTTGLKPGGERSEVTLLLSDLRGFTKACAGMEVEDVVAMLNDYYSELVQIIFEHGGTIDKFIGDAILAVFGSPEADPDKHGNAVRAALAMQTAMTRLNGGRRQRGQPACDLGVGLHTGPVLHGFIGAKERLEFTVIGDAVNITARLADGAGAGEVVVSAELHAHIRHDFLTEEKMIPIKHAEPMKVWRVTPPP